jgi:hypothetical protein
LGWPIFALHLIENEFVGSVSADAFNKLRAVRAHNNLDVWVVSVPQVPHERLNSKPKTPLLRTRRLFPAIGNAKGTVNGLKRFSRVQRKSFEGTAAIPLGLRKIRFQLRPTSPTITVKSLLFAPL